MAALVVTGSPGLLGAEVCSYFASLGDSVHGIDSSHRAVFVGPQEDTRRNQRRLEEEPRRFAHHELDVRDRAGMLTPVQELRPAAVIHAAAQPSHDRA